MIIKYSPGTFSPKIDMGSPSGGHVWVGFQEGAGNTIEISLTKHQWKILYEAIDKLEDNGYALLNLPRWGEGV